MCCSSSLCALDMRRERTPEQWWEEESNEEKQQKNETIPFCWMRGRVSFALKLNNLVGIPIVNQLSRTIGMRPYFSMFSYRLGIAFSPSIRFIVSMIIIRCHAARHAQQPHAVYRTNRVARSEIEFSTRLDSISAQCLCSSERQLPYLFCCLFLINGIFPSRSSSMDFCFSIFRFIFPSAVIAKKASATNPIPQHPTSQDSDNNNNNRRRLEL